MQHRRPIAAIAVAAMVAGAAQPATARLIAYTVTFTASGSVAGQPFTDREVKLAYLGDTKLVSVDRGTGGASVAPIIAAGSLIAGLGFVVAALFKFHQHKQNPSQGLAIESSTPAASEIQLSGRKVEAYQLGRERSPVDATVSGALPLGLPVLTEAGTSTLVITSVGSGRATFGARFTE